MCAGNGQGTTPGGVSGVGRPRGSSGSCPPQAGDVRLPGVADSDLNVGERKHVSQAEMWAMTVRAVRLESAREVVNAAVWPSPWS